MVNDLATGENQAYYRPLASDAPSSNNLASSETCTNLSSDVPSKLRSRLMILCAVAGCMLTSGLVFGFSAILPVLVDHGVFREKCPDAHSHESVSQPCAAQSQALTNMFTFGTCALNIVSLITGTILDMLGPRKTATGACCVVCIGCLIFACGKTGTSGAWNYYIGFLLMAVFGPPFFSTTVSFGNLFPNRFGTILAACIGGMDASSSVFLFLAELYGSGMSFEHVFGGYALVPLSTALVALILWPEEHIKRQATIPHSEDSGSPTLYYSLQHKRKSVSEQLMCAEFWLTAYSVSVYYVLINFFIATADEQITEFVPQSAAHLSSVFAIMLPAAGVVCAPVVGLVPDTWGPLYAWGFLWGSCFLYNFLLCLVLPFWEGNVVSYVAFAFLTFSRPLLFTVTAAYVSHMFGFKTFGRVHGSVFTLAGFANVSVSGLKSLSNIYGYQVANRCMFVLTVSAVALPLMLFWRNRREQKLEARNVVDDFRGPPIQIPKQPERLTPEKVFQRQKKENEPPKSEPAMKPKIVAENYQGFLPSTAQHAFGENAEEAQHAFGGSADVS